jgi:hypothetical protein
VLLNFARKLTLSPQAVTPHDSASLQSSGLNRGAVEEGILIVVGFNFINRIADALHFETPSSSDCLLSARFLRRFGYRALAGLNFQFRIEPWIRSTSSTRTGRGEKEILLASTERWFRFLSCLGLPAMRMAPDVAKSVQYRVLYEPAAVTADDVAELERCGCTEDDVFDLVLGAAATAGLMRLQAGLHAISVF